VNAKKFKRLGNQQPSSFVQSLAHGEGPTTIPKGSRVQEDSKRKGEFSLLFCLLYDKLFLIKFRGRFILWAKDFTSCVGCGTTERKHMAKGLCTRCYSAKYSSEHLDKVNSQKKKWYRENITPEMQRIKREQINFGGMREEALLRDNYKCSICGECRLSKLTVHHCDGNGRGSMPPNNSIDNLQTLCRACHAALHGKNIGWARDYDCCIVCGKTDKRHNARGYCTRCYWKFA